MRIWVDPILPVDSVAITGIRHMPIRAIGRELENGVPVSPVIRLLSHALINTRRVEAPLCSGVTAASALDLLLWFLGDWVLCWESRYADRAEVGEGRH